MYRSSLFLTAALIGTTIALVQPVAAAKSASEVEAIAKAVVVEIRLQKDGSVGSGVIIDRQGDLYTLVTNGHVVCGGQPCSELPLDEVYSLGLADGSTSSRTGQQYQVKASSIKLLGNNLDLAIIQFRSNRNYDVAKVAASGSLKVENDVYTAGFPLEQPGFAFGEGKAIVVVNKRLAGDGGGYTVIYDAPTLSGMSGGGVFNSNGQLVAIHGKGDRFRENTQIKGARSTQASIGDKTGYNRGILVSWLNQGLIKHRIRLSNFEQIGLGSSIISKDNIADEYMIEGFNKLVEPGSEILAGKREAIQKFTQTILLKPRYIEAYFFRGLAYDQIGQYEKSVGDFSQIILINPHFVEAFNNRGVLRYQKLNDLQGALSDLNTAISFDSQDARKYYNRGLVRNKLNDLQGALDDIDEAILLDSKLVLAYNNRGNIKTSLSDFRGALADYNIAISLDPQNALIYLNRGGLKYNKLRDKVGAVSDMRQAAKLARLQDNSKILQAALNNLEIMGFVE
jgi:tetratricopeptide (TPR) repeat protein